MTEPTQDTRMAIGEILGTTKHIVKTVDQLQMSLHQTREELRQEQLALQARLTKVEQYMWRQVGLATAAAVVIPVITSLIVWWITRGM